jgi:protein phosphatase
MRNVLTNVLGAREQVEVHLRERGLRGGESLLLCSDGLYGMLKAETMQQVLETIPDVAVAAQTLVEKALDAGSRDNVTALVVRYEMER